MRERDWQDRLDKGQTLMNSHVHKYIETKQEKQRGKKERTSEKE